MSLLRAKPAGPAESIDPRAFDLTCLAVAVLLALHAMHLPAWLTAVLALVLAGRWWQRRRHRPTPPGWLKLPLLAALLLGVVARYGNLFGPDPGTAFAVGLLVLKLLETESVRDARVALGFTCFVLMSALLFDQGLASTALVALGLIPTLAALRALEPARLPSGFARELAPAALLLGAALPLALLAFLLVPRLGGPLWGNPSSQQASAGLSDNLAPGDFTRLLDDDSPALRVSFDSQPPPPVQRYFRAYVMWDYDGRQWAAGSPIETRAEPIAVSGAIRYHVSLQPNHQRALPALDMPLGAPADATLSPSRTLVAARPVNDPLDYTVLSALRYRLDDTLAPAERRRALALPDDFDPRTQALAAQWRRHYGANDAAIVDAALRMFHDDGFIYTLTPPPLNRDAVDDFLFATRQGFCAHYASSFAVLMRAAGVPARVVTGYQGGYWNSMGSYLLVRQSDAHAWSEIWLAGRGWVRVDPTAAVSPDRVELGAQAADAGQLPWYQGGWLQNLRNRWDIVNRWWNLSVVGFSAARQRGLLRPFGMGDLEDGRLLGLLASAVALFATLGLLWALRRREHDTDPARAAFGTLERKLARAGLPRRRDEGPQHYLARAGRALPEQKDVLRRLLACYADCRYAHDEPPPESLAELRCLVREFRPGRVVQ